jgi:hypothetical protein
LLTVRLNRTSMQSVMRWGPAPRCMRFMRSASC